MFDFAQFAGKSQQIYFVYLFPLIYILKYDTHILSSFEIVLVISIQTNTYLLM